MTDEEIAHLYEVNTQVVEALQELSARVKDLIEVVRPMGELAVGVDKLSDDVTKLTGQMERVQRDNMRLVDIISTKPQVPLNVFLVITVVLCTLLLILELSSKNMGLVANSSGLSVRHEEF